MRRGVGADRCRRHAGALVEDALEDPFGIDGRRRIEAIGAEPDTIDFDGYDIHPGFFDDVAAVNLIKDLGRLSCPGLILQLSHRTDAAPETTQLMTTLGSRAKLECLRMEPFWDKLDDVDTGPMIERVVEFIGEY